MALRDKAYNWQGKRVEGVINADSEDAAYNQLRQDNLVAYELTSVRVNKSFVQRYPSLFKPGTRDLVDFSRQLSSLLRSGIPLRQSMRVLHDESRNLGMKEALRQIIANIEGGERFSDACAQHPTVFPQSYVRLLKIGEATGSLTVTLEQLASTLQKSNEVKGKVRRALTYPAISLIVAIIAGFILVRFSLPALVKLLGEFGGTLPPATRLLITLTGGITRYGFYIALLFFAFLGLLAAAIRNRSGARVRDRLLLKMPVVGQVIIQSQMFALTSTLAALLDAGISMVEALKLTDESLGNVVIRDALKNVVAQAEAGERFGQALRDQPVIPSLLAQGVATGEVSGNLPDTLKGLADYYQQQTDRSISAATELLQPLVILLVAGVVGFIAYAVVGGLYSTLGSVNR